MPTAGFVYQPHLKYKYIVFRGGFIHSAALSFLSTYITKCKNRFL